jgi:hypothetical protein
MDIIIVAPMNQIPPVALVFSSRQTDGVCVVEDLDTPSDTRTHKTAAYLLGPYDLEHEKVVYDAYKMSFVYRQNPGYKWFTFTLGYHQYDTECLLFLVHKATLGLEWIFFSTHSKAEGHWRKPGQCHYDHSGRLLAYVSPTSHAMYPDPGTHYRLYGLANDRTEENGILWYVPAIVMVPMNEPKDRRSHYNQPLFPPNKTISSLDRFFGLSKVQKYL